MSSYALKLTYLEGNYSVQPWLFGEPSAERLKEVAGQVKVSQEIISAQLVDQDPWTVLAEHHVMVVGRTLFLHFTERNFTRKATVTKVGRKWVELSDRERIDKDTLHIDGGVYSSPGRAYWTEEAFHAEMALNAAWSSFVSSVERFRYTTTKPQGLTVEKIQKAAELLGIPVP